MKRTILFLFIAALASLYGCINEPESPTLIINGGTPGMKGDSLGIITAHSIEVFSVIANQNGAKVEECGFLVVREGTTDTLSVPVTVAIDKAPIYIKATIDNLEADTYYLIYPYARNKAGRGIGSELKARTKNGMPEVQTLVSTDSIRGHSAYAGLFMREKGNSPIIRIGVLIDDNPNMSSADTISLAQAIQQGNDSLIVRVGNLNMTTTYYVQAFATNVYGMYKGEVLLFTTTDGSPILGKLEISDIKYTDVAYSTTIISDGESNIISKGICWTIAPYIPSINDNVLMNNTADFTGHITSLISGVGYNARAFAVNANGTAYSDSVYFLTANDWELMVFNIAEGSALARADITKKGITDITAVGFCWATHPEPTIEDNVRLMETNFISPFSGSVTQLRGESTYYLRAFVKNTSGFITYSSSINFETPKIFIPQTEFPGSARLPNSVSAFTNRSGDIAYILGGDQGTGLTNELWAYNANGQWHGMAPFPDKPRKWQSTVMVNNIAYVFGGVDNSNTSTNKLYQYTPSFNQWDSIPIAGMWPEAVHSAAGTPFYDLACFIGGNRKGVASNEVWAYNPLYESWERRPNFPVGIQKGIAISIQNKLYAGLGYTGASGAEYERRLWSMPYNGDTWVEETSLPDAAGTIRSAVALQNVYRRAIFMVDNSGTIWMYDIDTKLWEQKTILPSSNYGDHQHCMFVLDNYIYIGLGISYKSLLKYDHAWDN
jgi:FlaG/FlaF family flagellin (archaellin)